MAVANAVSFDEDVPQHALDLYDYAATAPVIHGFDAVTETDLARYDEQGFIAIEGAFNPAEIASALAGLDELIAGQIPAFQNIQFRADVRDRLDTLTRAERLDAVRRLLYFTPYEARTNAIAHHPKLIRLVERLLGAPPEMFQDMALVKPPAGREKPWHQDHAYFELPLDARVVGVWIALDPAEIENGCMRVLPGWHRRGVQSHFQLRDWQLCDAAMNGLSDQRVAVPLAPGGCLIFDSYLPHGTPSNFTRTRRRALQFHYKAATATAISADERAAIWGGEANRVAC